MEIRTQSNEVAPTWDDCCGTHGFTEWRVWVDGALIIDTFDTGHSFDDEQHAIDNALWSLESPDQ